MHSTSQAIVFRYTDISQEEVRNRPFWVVALSNGEEFYQGDRDDVKPWLELKKYCNDNSLFIEKFYLRFRDNYQAIPENQEAYYYIDSILASFIGYSQSFAVMGYLENEKVYCRKYLLPELLELENDIRDASDENVKEILIGKNIY